MATKLSSLKRKAAPKHSHEAKNPRKVQKVTQTQQIDTFPSDDEDEENAVTLKTKLISSQTTKRADSGTGNDSEQDEVEEVEEDDQTAALLQGFESSSEEGDKDEDENVEDDEEEDVENRTVVPALRKSKALKAQLAAAAKKSSSSAADAPGVVYVGRIPHGFYEAQMRSYFSQFGDITRLRLSRNRRTGASKHYAFIEFASGEVASIVANTMDNYLILNHLLKVKRLAPEQVHAELFKGAHKRFHKVPWTKIDRFRADNVDRRGWNKRIAREQVRREKKAAQLKELGYELDAPSLRQVDDVPVRQRHQQQKVSNGSNGDGDSGRVENAVAEMTDDKAARADAPVVEEETVKRKVTSIGAGANANAAKKEAVAVAVAGKGSGGGSQKQKKTR